MGARDELTGRTLGEFVLCERIGEGGFGEVYRCEQPLLGRQAVVKVLHRNLRENEVPLQRFLREARLASRLDHPYAAHVYAFGVEKNDGLLWIAMEMVHGTTLDRWLRDRGRLPLEQFVPFFERIAEVVHTAHERGIVHRDLKPANVMVVERAGRLLPKLLDFGIAKLVDDEAPTPAAKPARARTPTGVGLADTVAPELKRSEVDTLPASDKPAAGPASNGQVVLTQDGAALGSPPYMAPEQWNDVARVGASADLYALGILAYEALAGRRPFTATTLSGYIELHASAPVPPIGLGPAPLDAFFARALAKQPDARYANALELASALRVASGLAEVGVDLPRLDEGVRDAWLTDAPQALAETVAALEGARNAHQARDTAWELARGIVRYLVAIALASRAQVREDRVDPQLAELLRACCRHDLGDGDRAKLIRAIARPFHGRRGAFPIPELVDLVTPRADGNDALDRLLGLQGDSDAGARVSDDQVRAHLARLLPELVRLMRTAAFVLDYPLVVTRGGAVERWTGLRRPRRPLATVRDREPAEHQPALIDRDGRVALQLSPLVQILAPATGADEEMFVFDGHGRHGARLAAAPGGFEHRDESVWDWFGEQVIGEPTTTAIPHDTRAPYLGLSSFGADDADRFVGREREVDAFINRLRRTPLQVVVGASGAGKSSFVHAGVLPNLPAGWRTVTVRPGASPVSALSSRLVSERLTGAAEPSSIVSTLVAESRDGFLVIVIDQLEELFTLCTDEVERTAFAEMLARLSASSEVAIRVVCTVRDDFLMRVEALAPLRARLSPALFLLGNPSRQDLVRCIVEPARRAGYEFSDSELAAEMVETVADRPGALALLSFTASRLWELRDRRVQQLSRKAYEAMGGVGGALGGHADAMLAELGTDEQRLVRETFRQLVTADGTRAVLSLAELREILASPRADAVIDKLVSARLVVVTEGEPGAQIEIAHEALITAWPRLGGWIREDATGARMRDQVRSASRQWDERGRPGGLLWRDDALLELERWRREGSHQLTDVEVAFADSSRAAATRSRRIRRGLAGAAIAVLAIAVAVLIELNSEANAQRIAADKNAASEAVSAAKAQALAADSQRRLAEQSEEQGRLALQSGKSGLALLHFLAAIDHGAQRTVALDFMLNEALTPLAGRGGVMRGHRNAVHFIEPVSRSLLVSAGEDGTARLWDVPSGKQIAIVQAPGPIGEAHLDPAQEHVLTAGRDGVARLYARDGRLVHELRSGTPPRQSPYPAFSPDGQRIATVDDVSAHIWNARTGRVELKFPVGDPKQSFLARRAIWSPTGDAIAVVGYATAELHDARTGGLRAYLRGHEQSVSDLAFSPDGSMLAIGAYDRSVRVWSVTPARLLHQLAGHAHSVEGVRFDPTSRFLVTASRDQTVRIWDPRSGRLHGVLDGHNAAVTAVAFDRAGTIIASGGEDGGVHVWEFPSGRPLGRFEGHASSVTSLAFVGADLVSASADETIRRWNLDHLGFRSIAAPCGDPSVVQLSPDSTRYVVGCQDGRVVAAALSGGVPETVATHPDEIMDVGFVAEGGIASVSPSSLRIWRAGREIVRVDGADKLIAAVSPDGLLFATGSESGLVVVYDVRTGVARSTWPVGEPITGLEFSPKGDRLGAKTSGSLFLYDVMTGTRYATLRTEGLVFFGFASTGELVTTSGNIARLWDAKGQPRHAPLTGHLGQIQRAAFDASGERLLSGSRDGTIRVWNTLDGRLVSTCEGHSGRIIDARFDSRGLIISVGVDRTMRVWDPKSGRQLQSYRDIHRTTIYSMNLAGDARFAITSARDGLLVTPFVHVPPALEQARALGRCVPFKLDNGRFTRSPTPDRCN